MTISLRRQQLGVLFVKLLHQYDVQLETHLLQTAGPFLMGRESGADEDQYTVLFGNRNGETKVRRSYG